MYRINNKESAIKEIQKYLSKIYKNQHTVSESGKFDEKTKTALHHFQTENEMEISDTVNYEPFTLLYSEYQNALQKEKIESEKISGVNFPLVRGTRHHFMLNANKMLSDILYYHREDLIIDINDYFSPETERGVHFIRELFQFPGNGEIDELLYWRIMQEWESVNKMNEYFS